MDKLPTNNEGKKNKYSSLRERLLNNSISFEKVRETLMSWDQSTLSRVASSENLKFLHDLQIVEFIAQHPEEKEGYYNFLSLTEFHVAQRLVESNQDEATAHFKKALESAQLGNGAKWWVAYVQGTVLYVEGKEIPEAVIEQAEDPINAQILRNFNAGLKERGSPSYLEDYRKK